MSKRVLCKFFAQGACLKGDHCDFSHDQKDPLKKVCKFYQKGFCSYGSRCRYEHVPISQSHFSTPSSSAPTLSASSTPFFPPTKPAECTLCSFAATGICPHGKKCPYIHGDLCSTCGKYCLHPFRPKEVEEHIKACEKQKNRLEVLKRSREIECGVCLERVLSKPTAAERKFGLLSECDHPFCISCIRNWRSTSPTIGMDLNSSLRACPLCRKLSYFVIPSVIWYCTKEEKQEIIDSYKSKLRSIDCKHFDFGNGTCPFGTSCFYKHTVEPGSFLWNSTLRLENDGPRFFDIDETDTLYSADELDMDGLHVLFEHLYRPHTPLEDEEDDEDEQEVEIRSVDELDEELSLADAMAFLLMQPGFDECDLSSDDDIYIP